MPLVGFRPTIARLVIEDKKDNVLVMRVVVDAEDTVELTTGGVLEELVGVLRIRERRAGSLNGEHGIGSIVYVAETQESAAGGPAKFQVNVTMAAEKFGTLLRVANAGRLPTKFFVDAGARPERAQTPALGYRLRGGHRIKVWDNHAHRILIVTNFVMILPIDIPPASINGAVTQLALPPGAVATNTQVAELADDMLVFQSDTRNTMFGMLCVLGLVAIAALAIGLAVFFR